MLGLQELSQLSDKPKECKWQREQGVGLEGLWIKVVGMGGELQGWGVMPEFPASIRSRGHVMVLVGDFSASTAQTRGQVMGTWGRVPPTRDPTPPLLHALDDLHRLASCAEQPVRFQGSDNRGWVAETKANAAWGNALLNPNHVMAVSKAPAQHRPCKYPHLDKGIDADTKVKAHYHSPHVQGHQCSPVEQSPTGEH